MNVHIITTPNEVQNLSVITSTLNNVPGELVFKYKGGKFITEGLYNRTAPQFFNAVDDTFLEFNDFFDYCNLYRDITKIDENDIVVFITSIKNRRKWFSAVENRNIFVYTGYWNEIVGEKNLYAIAYNVLVNIFQLLLGINHSETELNPEIIHRENVGCINDFCEEKKNVILKLRTGYICDKCIEHASKIMSNDIIVQLYKLIQNIREKFMNSDRITTLFEPEILLISENGKMEVGNIELKLSPFQKALFILMARHPEGIDIFSLQSEGLQDGGLKSELSDIHHTIRLKNLKKFINWENKLSILRRQKNNGRDDEPIDNLSNTNFQYHKSKMHEGIRNSFSPYTHRADIYYIEYLHQKNTDDEMTYLYKLKLDNELIENNFKIDIPII